jgi:hypothetical protein
MYETLLYFFSIFLYVGFCIEKTINPAKICLLSIFILYRFKFSYEILVSLNKAKKGINTMINDDRTTLWDSVLNDIKLTIFDNDKQMDISNLFIFHNGYNF